jgi:hypothetical protein
LFVLTAASLRSKTVVLKSVLLSTIAQECFNSPYGHVYFPSYAEQIGFKRGEKYDVGASESESVKVLSEAAKTEGVWLLGGPRNVSFPFFTAVQ